MDSILKVNNLTKWYGKIKAIENLHFEVNKGRVVGLLGPNGSGKTTTLATILGIIKPNKGSFSWFNEPEGVLANKRIGALIEVPYFFPYLNLERNLEIVAKVRGRGHNEIGKTLGIVGLDTRAKSPFSTLSLGMKQRLALASALLGDPEVLVLDEPTNGLDPEGIAEVRNVIIEQSERGKTIILASHILDEVEKVCNDVIILKNGSSISQGTVKELLTDKETVTISADDYEGLLRILSSIEGVEIIKKGQEKITVSLDERLTTSKINKLLLDQGIVLSTIETHKKTLESQFLELVKK